MVDPIHRPLIANFTLPRSWTGVVLPLRAYPAIIQEIVEDRGRKSR